MQDKSTNTAATRRTFLTDAAKVAAVATTATLLPLRDADAEGSTHSGPYDDSWTDRVRAAAHKAVFDSALISDGLALQHAWFFIEGYGEQFPGSACVPVVVMRHESTVLAFNDSLWAKYNIGEMRKLKDPRTSQDATRNPFIAIDADEKNALIPMQASLTSLRQKGAVLLACNKAAMRTADTIARRAGVSADLVRAEVKARLVEGVILQPSGIYANIRAQEAGCAVLKST